jgi:hypothetical protein
MYAVEAGMVSAEAHLGIGDWHAAATTGRAALLATTGVRKGIIEEIGVTG